MSSLKKIIHFVCLATQDIPIPQLTAYNLTIRTQSFYISFLSENHVSNH